MQDIAKAYVLFTTDPSGSHPKHVMLAPARGLTANVLRSRPANPSVSNNNLASPTNMPLAAYEHGRYDNIEMCKVPFFEHFGTAWKFTHGNHGTLTLKARTISSGVFSSLANAASRASAKEEPTASREEIQPTTSFRRNLSVSAKAAWQAWASPTETVAVEAPRHLSQVVRELVGAPILWFGCHRPICLLGCPHPYRN